MMSRQLTILYDHLEIRDERSSEYLDYHGFGGILRIHRQDLSERLWEIESLWRIGV
jgi:hypothetical protein